MKTSVAFIVAASMAMTALALTAQNKTQATEPVAWGGAVRQFLMRHLRGGTQDKWQVLWRGSNHQDSRETNCH